jgi:hypothetical protein
VNRKVLDMLLDIGQLALAEQWAAGVSHSFLVSPCHYHALHSYHMTAREAGRYFSSFEALQCLISATPTNPRSPWLVWRPHDAAVNPL